LSPNNQGFAMADRPERLNDRVMAHNPEKHVLDVIGDGNRFPAFAKPASAGEARSDKIMRGQESALFIPRQAAN
jgi:hypothetical protein